MNNYNDIITEQQAIRYEVGSLTVIGSFLFKWFTKYYLWKIKNRYKRYLWYIEYERLQNQKTMLQFMKMLPKNASHE